MSRPAKAPRGRGSAAAPSSIRRGGGARLPGIRPTALPAKGGADWYRRGVFYEVLTRGFFDSNDDGIGDLAGLRAKLDYLEWLGVDCLRLLPFYPSPMCATAGTTSATSSPCTPSSDSSTTSWNSSTTHTDAIQGDRRSRHEPHQRPTPLVRRVTVVSGQSQSGVVRVERRRPALARGARRLRRRGDVELDVGPISSAVLLAPLLLAPARPQLREPRGRRGHVRRGPLLARPRARRVPPRRRPLSLPEGRDHGREPPRDPRAAPSAPQGSGRRPPRPRAAGRSQPVALGPRRLLRQRRRVPHVLPLPVDAAPVHGRAPRAALPRHRDPGPDPRDPRQLPVGDLPAERTTSSPWRRSPRKSATTWWRST